MKILCSYCMKKFEEKELVYDGGEKTDYCPRCGEAYYAKVNEKRIRQIVFQSAHDKLYYDFRHVPIKSRLNDGIFFNSEEQPCGEHEVSKMEDADEGINISVYIKTSPEQQSQFEYEVSICYKDANNVEQAIFQENFLPENNFYTVVETIKLIKNRKEWKIPVTWQVYGFVTIEAPTLEKAMKIAADEEGVIPLPDNSHYVDGSWELSTDIEEEIRALFNDNQDDGGAGGAE